MSDDFEDIDDDLDEDLEEEDLEEDALDDDDDVEVDDLDVVAVDDDGEEAIAIGTAADIDVAVTLESEGDDDVMEIDDELHPDDVEAPLDALLEERVASTAIDDEEEDIFDEDESDSDDRGDGPTKIVPRRPGEFLCSSCFLVMPRHMLADETKSLCRDCA